MFYLTPQERKFLAILMIVFIAGAAVQLLFKRDIAPVRWFKSVRQFKININSARQEELQMLPGVGATLSSRIIDYRKDNGAFKSLEDLEDVDGMTEKHFNRIKGLIEL